MDVSQRIVTQHSESAGPVDTQARLAVRLEPGASGRATLVVTGRLDAAGGALVSAMLGHCGEHGERVRVCVDLSGVDSMDARGIRTLMAAFHGLTVRGASVTMTGLGVPIAHAEACCPEVRAR